MRIQTKVIRFTLFMSIFFGVITYLVTLNIEIGFLNLSVPWLSNNFALTVCGGAFASMLVVLIGEVQKYSLNKKAAEDFLFSHTAYVYGQLLIIKTHIQNRLNDPTATVPGELLSMPSNCLKNEIFLISNADYYTFLRRNKLTKEYQDFCNVALQNLANFVNASNYLDIAVLEDQMNNLKICGMKGTITSGSFYTGQVLRKFDSLVDPLIDEIDVFLQHLDEDCSYRFMWKTRRGAILKNWEQTPYHGFDEFTKQEGNPQ